MLRWFRKNGNEEFDREVGFHIEELVRENIARGMSPIEARRQAMITFGGREQTRQALRDVHTSPWLEAVSFNLKAAFRFIRRAPSFSAAIILILAVGIGANSAVFSAIDAVVLRPLPFPGGNELIAIYQHDAKDRDSNRFVAPVRLEDWNRLNSTFQAISGYYLDDLSETSGPLPEKVTEAMVAPRFLKVMRVAPILGRDFAPDEEHFGGPEAALISYAFWQRRFHGDPNALNRKLRIESSSYSIIGVMPTSFRFPNAEVDLWAMSTPDAPFAQRRDSTWFTVVGRLKTGVSLSQAQADLSTVQQQLGKQFPKPDADLIIQTTPLKETVVGDVRDSLWLLYGAVSVLLLIACSNIAALLLARMSDREHEIAIRYSLGAPRSAIIAQLLTEVLVLAVIGCVFGVVGLAGAMGSFQALLRTLPRAEEITLNGGIVLYSFSATTITTLLCGLFPAIHGTRQGLARSLAETERSQVSSRNRIQWTLVGFQVALAVTLLIGSGLLVRSFQEISRVSPGFDSSHVLTFQISGSWGETTDMKQLNQRIDRTLDGIRTLPGVESAATSGMLPGVATLYQLEFKIDGKSDPAHKVLADSRYVSAGYFDTMQIPLLLGEACKQASSTAEVLVNRSFVNMYLRGTSPTGHVIQAAAYNDFQPAGQIRGVVGDAREEGLTTPAAPTVYSCLSAPDPFPNYLVRTRRNPASMAEAIRRRVNELEPQRSVYAVMPLQDHLDDASAENRFRTMLLALFATSALLLACIGLYGTLSYLGRLRQREIGIRLALGALKWQIVAGFMMQGLGVTIIGSVAGLILSLTGDRLIANMLYGVKTLDAETYGAVLLLISLVATAASLIPAWRSAGTEPTQALRQQ
ncbi:MAG TPA: ABC transporter permease [Candidatus Sulfotelmatobacter sp.]|nr:ABC transporter permease [Candidatus Sulfotelmatobacter sp.]